MQQTNLPEGLPEADPLMTFLEQTLQQLELVSGGEDTESRSKLEELRDALSQPAASGSRPLQHRSPQQQPVADVDEAAMLAMLEK